MTARGPSWRQCDDRAWPNRRNTPGADKSQTLSGGDRGVFERIASPQA